MTVLGIIGVLGGLAGTVFNKQLAAWMLPRVKGKLEIWDTVLSMKAYQRTSSGRVPILMVISVGWIIVGVVFIATAR